MEFKVLNTGINAAMHNSTEGPWIRVAKFRVGSAYGYTPDPLTDTDIHGTLLHEGVVTGYRVLDSNTCEFILRMDELVGSWQFGEVALVMHDGTAIALGTLTRPQWKIAYPDADFNRYLVYVRLHISDGIPRFELVTYNVTPGVIAHIDSLALLPLPSEDPPSNVYLLDGERDQTHNSELLILNPSKGRWTFSQHTVATGNFEITSWDIVSGSITCTAAASVVKRFPKTWQTPPFNRRKWRRFSLQILSGPLQGLCRDIEKFTITRSGATVTIVIQPHDIAGIYWSNLANCVLGIFEDDHQTMVNDWNSYGNLLDTNFNIDLNDVDLSGAFYVPAHTSNMPIAAVAALEVASATGGLARVQRLSYLKSGAVYQRVYIGKWGPWRRLDNAGGSTVGSSPVGSYPVGSPVG